MAYRNLIFRSLATDIRTETYLGEDHIVVPCIALVGDEVVYGMNAEGPEFIPADELAFSTLGWSGRPVLYDHPSNSTSTANEPSILEAMSFGQIFHPRFEDNKLKVEAWCNKSRAIEIGQEDLITSIENGEVIELSVGAIISIEKRNGVAPNGKAYTAIWHDVQSDHLAIGLSGSQGACNIEMGCGTNRTLKGNEIGNVDTRTMRANRGVDTMPVPEIRTTTATKSKARARLLALDIKPRSLKDRILSFASQAFRSSAEDQGLSDKDLRDKLWDQLYAVEPAFYGIEDVFQESSTVTYITSPDKRLHMWRRTFEIADDGAVTINDDREEVAVTDFHYIYMGENPTSTVAAQADSDKSKPCGCQSVSADQSVAANEIDKPKEDSAMPDDKDKKTPDATPPAGGTAPAMPAAPTVPTPEKGSSEAATPSQSGSTDKTIPNYPAGEPNPSGDLPGTGTAVTSEQLKALLEAHPVVKHYRAQEAKERTGLIAALVKAQKVLTQTQLEAKPIEDLRQIAELVGIGMQTQQSPCGDFSGRMMVARESELPPPPDPHGVAKYLKGRDTTN